MNFRCDNSRKDCTHIAALNRHMENFCVWHPQAGSRCSVWGGRDCAQQVGPGCVCVVSFCLLLPSSDHAINTGELLPTSLWCLWTMRTSAASTHASPPAGPLGAVWSSTDARSFLSISVGDVRTFTAYSADGFLPALFVSLGVTIGSVQETL